jgi:hypothetical protein
MVSKDVLFFISCSVLTQIEVKTKILYADLFPRSVQQSTTHQIVGMHSQGRPKLAWPHMGTWVLFGFLFI